jgi:hypothetical protein
MMYDVGNGIIQEYIHLGGNNYLAKGEIVSIHEDEYGDTLYTIMFEDGATKVYTKNVMDNPRVLVTQEVIW